MQSRTICGCKERKSRLTADMASAGHVARVTEPWQQEGVTDPEAQGGGLGAGTRQVKEPVMGGRPGRYGTEPGSTCEARGGTGFFGSQFEAHLSE